MEHLKCVCVSLAFAMTGTIFLLFDVLVKLHHFFARVYLAQYTKVYNISIDCLVTLYLIRSSCHRFVLVSFERLKST